MRYDADAGLQYLNARYYDPRLGMFIQPDWFDPMKLGVGTNCYSYSFNDPINLDRLAAKHVCAHAAANSICVLGIDVGVVDADGMYEENPD